MDHKDTKGTKEHLKFAPNDRVLHYPCGDGALCREIAPQVEFGVVVGLDPSEDKIRAARAASRDIDNIMYVWCEPQEIPWKEDYFSHAVVEDATLSLRELFRVLAAGGRLHWPAASFAELEAVGFQEIQREDHFLTAIKP